MPLFIYLFILIIIILRYGSFIIIITVLYLLPHFIHKRLFRVY